MSAVVRRTASGILLVSTLLLSVASAPRPAAAAETVALAFDFGWVSPVADPDVSEGYGVGASLFVRIAQWFGARLSLDVAQHSMEGELSMIPARFTSGDIVFGPVFEVTRQTSPVALRLFFETGAYWAAYILGLFWSWGIDFGSTFVWRITDYFGLQAELRYHIYNLSALEDEVMLCPRTLQPLGPLDRLDLTFGIVMAI
jgi:hypothetical protein